MVTARSRFSSGSSGIHSRILWTRPPKSRPPPAIAVTAAGGALLAAARVAEMGTKGRSAADSIRSFRSASQRAATASPPSAVARARRSVSSASRTGAGSVAASRTCTSASVAFGQELRQLLPEGAGAGVGRWHRDDEQVAGAGAGHVLQPVALGPGLRLVGGDEAVPARRLAARAEAQGDTALVPQGHEVRGHAERVRGVEEDDHRRLQALGLVDGEDAHRVRISGTRGGQVRLLAGLQDSPLQEVREAAQGEDAQLRRPGGRARPPSPGSRSGPRRAACP